MQALTDTRKNLADYQNALKDFQATVKDSGSLISNMRPGSTMPAGGT